jgi:hypothetical protein
MEATDRCGYLSWPGKMNWWIVIGLPDRINDMSVIQAPVELVEALAELRLPPRADRRLQELMDRNTNGELTEAERMDLEALVEWSESVAPMRAQALLLLGRKPG